MRSISREIASGIIRRDEFKFTDYADMCLDVEHHWVLVDSVVERYYYE